ncbi:MAG: LysE family translocator [Elstera sp.]
MADFTQIAVYAASVTVLLLTPGPVNLLVVRAGLAGGMRGAFRVVVGTAAASLVLILATALLVNGVFSLHPAVFASAQLAGCLYLVWLAVGMIRRMRAQRADLAGALPVPAGIGQGFAIAISNPKYLVFFSSFLPQFLDVLPTPSQSLALLGGIWLFLVFTALSGFAYAVRRLIRPKFHGHLLLGASFLLLGFGLFGAGWAVKRLLALG